MIVAVMGAGARAVRVRFHDGGVQIRHGVHVIDGNGDLARALDWVIAHPEIEAERIPGNDFDVASICSLLRQLAHYDLPLSLWGDQWANACLSFAEDGHDQ